MEAVGTLAGGIAHDFNNLLMGIQGYASLMLMNIDGSHPHYERLRIIEEYVESGADLTRQLLAFARGGKYEIKPANLNEIVEKSSILFGRTKKEIRIERRFEPDLWTVDLDRGQMEQVLLNLYVNAWHAMPGGGDLTLETANLRLTEGGSNPFDAPPGDYVRISVRDTGVGMDEKTKSRIFEPFFTTKEMGRGTGLGLASVYGIIQGHGGSITVESEKGKGAAFHICLPASHRAVSGGGPAGKDLVEKGHETILLVDDEEGILNVSKALLMHLGYRVLAAKSGREALDIYAREGKSIDLVILDMIMPGMSGGETFDRLKELDPNISVILSSGYSLDGMASRIMQQGCRCFIQKPFSLSSLSQKIREALAAP
jgi:CheY-like chemotaxis protein